MSGHGLNRRGRPPEDADRGAATDAERSAAYRQRAAARRASAAQEIEELARSLLAAKINLFRLGYAVTHPYGSKVAEAAIRRATPELAVAFDQLHGRAITEYEEQEALRSWLNPEAVPGPKRGSVLVEGRAYWMQPNGIVVCDGKPTALRIHHEAMFWVITSRLDRHFRNRRIFARDVVVAKVIEHAARLLQSEERSKAP